MPDPSELYVRAEVVCRLSAMFRSRGCISDSDRLVTEFFGSQKFGPESGASFTYIKPIIKLTISTLAGHVRKLANGVLQAMTPQI